MCKLSLRRGTERTQDAAQCWTVLQVDGEDISGDGEVVLKRVAGTKGWKHPKAGEKATIKYKGMDVVA
jgi:hypothetical protein